MHPYALLPVLAAATLFLAIGFPLLRHWMQFGQLALMHPRDEVQRFVHSTFSATLVGYGAWTIALLTLGPDALGVTAVSMPVIYAGFAVAGAGLLITIAAQAQMGRAWRIGIDTEHPDLVTHGLFRVSRNPIYLGILGVVLGIAILAPSGWTVVGVVLCYVEVGFQARAEEAILLAEHGDAYREWAGRVGRFVPGIGTL